MRKQKIGALPSRKQQAGLGLLGWLAALGLASFALTCFFRIGPIYLEYWQTKKAIDLVVGGSRAASMPKNEIINLIDKQFEVSRIDSIKTQDIKVTDSKSGRELNANYEKRVELIGNIDVVVKFDKLVYKLSSSE